MPDEYLHLQYLHTPQPPPLPSSTRSSGSLGVRGNASYDDVNAHGTMMSATVLTSVSGAEDTVVSVPGGLPPIAIAQMD